MFANTKKLLTKAYEGKYAIAHFNINNMEITQGVVQAAVNKKAPIILATSEGAIKYAGLNYLRQISQTSQNLTNVPIALHLDHGRDIQTIKNCIKAGFSSVMFDGSNLDYKTNLKITRQLTNLAHKNEISLEAELGTIGGAEDLVSAKKIIYTQPEQAKEFVEKTGCDFLAVAIGTSHGAYKFKTKAKLKIDILKEIKRLTKVPLVLHGASGVPKEIVNMAQKYGANLKGVMGVHNSQIKLAIKNGISKINTDTDLRLAFDAAVRQHLKKNPKDFDPRHILAPARNLITKVAEKRIETFGSSNKAWPSKKTNIY